jgi:hypothetical protein
MKLISIILISLLLLEGCDIFETRNPEQPSNARSNFKTPVEPKDVIDNLMNSFVDKNANDYKKNFSLGAPLVSRDFYFLPSGNVSISFPENWNADDEFLYFNNLITRTSQDLPFVLSFSLESYDIRSDSAIYSAEYFLSVPDLNSGSKLYEGNLKFMMKTDINNTWVIYYWEDIAKSGSMSWSELKIEFYL